MPETDCSVSAVFVFLSACNAYHTGSLEGRPWVNIEYSAKNCEEKRRSEQKIAES